MAPEIQSIRKCPKILLVGVDDKQILQRRFQSAGCHVVTVSNNEAACDHARQAIFDTTVLVSRGSLINIAETIFNLRDINRSMEIIILVEPVEKSNRLFRKLFEHPIDGTQILTRRQLQKQLHETAPPGQPF